MQWVSAPVLNEMGIVVQTEFARTNNHLLVRVRAGDGAAMAVHAIPSLKDAESFAAGCRWLRASYKTEPRSMVGTYIMQAGDSLLVLGLCHVQHLFSKDVSVSLTLVPETRVALETRK